MVANTFLDSLFSNSLCSHAMFERSIDVKEHNPSRTFSNGRVICWNKFAWVLATQKQEELSVNN